MEKSNWIVYLFSYFIKFEWIWIAKVIFYVWFLVFFNWKKKQIFSTFQTKNLQFFFDKKAPRDS